MAAFVVVLIMVRFYENKVKRKLCKIDRGSNILV